MDLSVDLHIHSCLSPCGDVDMTPNNIVNMALLKGLDVIAITDHNSGENVPAVMECAKNTDLLVVPGMELETQEEVHVVCLFPDTAALFDFQKLVYENMPPMPNRPEIFGHQMVLDSEDKIIGECDKMLINACNISIDDAFHIITELGGTAYPAHIDRDAYSILTNLGDIPGSYKGKYLELSGYIDANHHDSRTDRYFSSKMPKLINRGYSFIKSSDAHYLGQIMESGNYLDLCSKSICALLAKLGKAY